MTDAGTTSAPTVPSPPLNLTPNRRAVIDVLAHATAHDPVFCGRICAVTGLGPSTVQPILQRLVDAGWVRSWIEQDHQRDVPDQPRRPGGPRRRYYQLTDTGLTATHELPPCPDIPADAAGSQNPPVFRGGMTKRAVR